jgi:ankyrin repeat protein
LLLNLTDIDVCPANLKGMTPIHYASRSKDKNLLKLLLDRDKNNPSLYLVCQDQGNPLHCLLENPSNNVESGDDDLLECIDLLGAIFILREHFYSTKLNLTFKFFIKTGFFFVKTKEYYSTLRCDKIFMM